MTPLRGIVLLLTGLAWWTTTLPGRAQQILDVPAAYPSIQSALAVAQSGDTVRVAPGIYAERIDFLGKDVVLRSTAGSQATVIDAQATPASSGTTVRFTSGEGPGAVLDGFTVRGGNGTQLTAGVLPFPTPTFGAAGAGILVIQASPTIRNCRITDNQLLGSPIGEFGGHGICLIRAGGEIADCVIDLNGTDPALGDDGLGGGIYALDSTTLIRRSRISGHTWSGVCFAGGSPILRDCRVENNAARDGGGVLLLDGTIPGHPVLERVHADQNIAARFGGGVACRKAPATFITCEIAFNTAGDLQQSGCGGGLFFDGLPQPTGSVTLDRCTVVGNGASLEGGGIELRIGGALVLNSVVAGNTAGFQGGGIAVSDPTVLVAHSTIADNDGGAGVGGLAAAGAPFLGAFCLVSGNTSPQIGAGLAPFLVESAVLPSSSGLYLDAASFDYHLAPGSPAIDQSSLASAAPHDLDGEPRSTGGAIDLGADEFRRPFPGNADPDLRLATAADSPVAAYPTLRLPVQGHLVVAELTSPSGALLGSYPLLLAQVYPSAGPPPGPSGYTGLHLDPALPFLILHSGYDSGPLGPSGAQVAGPVPPGLGGFTARVQGLVLGGNPLTLSCSDAHEFSFY